MANSIGPGPAYSLPPTIGYDKHDLRKNRSPQFTMAGRFKDRYNKVPGPAMDIQGATRFGKPNSLAYSMSPRAFRVDPKKIGPGPAHYDLRARPYVQQLQPPSYSIGRRNTFEFKNRCPGANAYSPNDRPIRKTAPSFSIGLKCEIKPKPGSPGPGGYEPSKLRVTLNKAPEYSIAPRFKVVDKNIVPGASTYDRSAYKPGNRAPEFSFGVRHSPKSPPYVTKCDNL